MREAKYPTMGDDREWKYKGWPHSILVTWSECEQPQRFCGDNWCTGDCGLPALMLPPPGDSRVPRKASGSQVACGEAFQWLRVERWNGPIVMVPDEHREVMGRMMYW